VCRILVENFLQVLEDISHETLHYIIYQLEGSHATTRFDYIPMIEHFDEELLLCGRRKTCDYGFGVTCLMCDAFWDSME